MNPALICYFQCSFQNVAKYTKVNFAVFSNHVCASQIPGVYIYIYIGICVQESMHNKDLARLMHLTRITDSGMRHPMLGVS